MLLFILRYVLFCLKRKLEDIITNSKAENAFTTDGFRNWKKSISKYGFTTHEKKKNAHSTAMVNCVKAPSASCSKVPVFQSTGIPAFSWTTEITQQPNKKVFLTILSNIRYLNKFGTNSTLYFVFH